ncbi:hypothetical protein Val02_15150 [Virgisporangium aliadipatigenens]|uniref:Uncharacterized protein n=1 Tax=Virgisporangium aliadipatigenens TaxID=741659 RepID=A0A8J3YG84_9ACTN|nr:hypothetical protein Val02_15150 [Virgisporangium aliadipatigenens]
MNARAERASAGLDQSFGVRAERASGVWLRVAALREGWRSVARVPAGTGRGVGFRGAAGASVVGLPTAPLRAGPVGAGRSRVVSCGEWGAA